ncbi:hypothetical protein A45J_1861 [hot springs metagenome]|uniref:Uncharacterized protein n=1 Tax=hot springs metagenome TaxID=433727 RepID=A0A5J4L352_9ZZZZ
MWDIKQHASLVAVVRATFHLNHVGYKASMKKRCLSFR